MLDSWFAAAAAAVCLLIAALSLWVFAQVVGSVGADARAGAFPLIITLAVSGMCLVVAGGALWMLGATVHEWRARDRVSRGPSAGSRAAPPASSAAPASHGPEDGWHLAAAAQPADPAWREADGDGAADASAGDEDGGDSGGDAGDGDAGGGDSGGGDSGGGGG